MMAPMKRKAADATASANKRPNATITSFFGSKTSSSGTEAAPSSSQTIPTSPTSAKDDTSPKSSQSTVTTGTTTVAGTTGIPKAPIFGGSGAKGRGPASRFDKAKWVEKLTPEQKDLLALEIETLHESWLAQLKDEVLTKEFLALKKFLKQEHESGKTIFPPAPDVYSWSRHTPLDTVKVVILGQDPYHNNNQAHGLCFSVRPPTRAPPSLNNIYKLLKIEYPDTFTPPPNKGGLLTPWADRGVLLLNTCLTVRAHEPNSHASKGWEKFTQKVIDTVARQRTRGVVFLAWGSPAAKRVNKIDTLRHCVLQAVHPSPLSAERGFFQCNHFTKTNDWLKTRYGIEGPIDWSLDVPPEKAGV